MIHRSLEEHLDKVCPNCGKEHNSKWVVQFDKLRCYAKQDCLSCGYEIFKKLDFMTCGTVPVDD